MPTQLLARPIKDEPILQYTVDKINLTNSSAIDFPMVIAVYDLLGQELIRSESNITATRQGLDIAQLATGMYIAKAINLQTGQAVKSYKFMVNK